MKNFNKVILILLITICSYCSCGSINEDIKADDINSTPHVTIYFTDDSSNIQTTTIETTEAIITDDSESKSDIIENITTTETEAKNEPEYIVFKPSSHYIHRSTCKFVDDTCITIDNTENIKALLCQNCCPDIEVIHPYTETTTTTTTTYDTPVEVEEIPIYDSDNEDQSYVIEEEEIEEELLASKITEENVEEINESNEEIEIENNDTEDNEELINYNVDPITGYVLQYSDYYHVDSNPLSVSMGVKQFNNHRETYYSQRVLPGYGLAIPGRHVAYDGTVRDEDGYICVASDLNYLSRGSIILTSLGPGKVYDTGCVYGTIDIYVNW